MMEMTRTDPEWKDKIITGDETWVYGYDPETKPQSAEWRGTPTFLSFYANSEYVPILIIPLPSILPYAIRLQKCYIGETGRSIRTRLSEHNRNIRTNDRKSLFCQHITEFRHSFNLDSAVCVYKGVGNKYQRLVLESLVSHCTPSFNRKIDLPPQYSVFYPAIPPS
ncbi:hypothetical protein LAZ67_12002365 [Cordylochernes scorpioides]|uniref:GIY-YIG domain-containing protein n=1 Tax=Cordylochernes scorpioides TaxID=51811 RepID=A0ABY6L587_9ARAC|nr:hypothetical protein LAZ67_12002365 [Cordylochernes scorpioides]